MYVVLYMSAVKEYRKPPVSNHKYSGSEDAHGP